MGLWKKCGTQAGPWVAPVSSCPSRLGPSHLTSCVSVRHWLWLGYLELAAIVYKSCPIWVLLRERTKAKAKGQSCPLTPPCMAVRGRQVSPCRHPAHSPRTFRPTRNMPDVQIPQVMREFVTRGVWAIQEWEPDRGLELERRSPSWPARAQVAASRLPRKRGRQRDGALWAASFLRFLGKDGRPRPRWSRSG